MCVCAEQRPTCAQTISADAPILFAKACELFILELTLRSWFHTDQNKRRTLQVDFRAAHPAPIDAAPTPAPWPMHLNRPFAVRAE